MSTSVLIGPQVFVIVSELTTSGRDRLRVCVARKSLIYSIGFNLFHTGAGAGDGAGDVVRIV
jgi:hypothetical protein